MKRSPRLKGETKTLTEFDHCGGRGERGDEKRVEKR